MEPMPKLPRKKGPERIIQDNLIKFLRGYDWLVKETHGNLYQSGFPDLYCYHIKYGQRWVEVKNPGKYSFTTAQMEWFPKFSAHQCGIWILTAANEAEYQKLFKPANWYLYLSIWSGSRS